MISHSDIPAISRDEIYDPYPHKVLDMLKEMFIGEVRPLDVTNKNYVRFVSTVKGIINAKLDRAWGFEIDFNPDYTKFRKLPYVPYSQSIFHHETRD